MTTRIQLRFARPHMHLAEPVLARDGTVVAGIGTTLNESVIRSLLRVGVESAIVREGEEVAEWEEAKDVGAALAALDARFASEAPDPVLAALRAALAKHLQARTEAAR